jgi:hypothetical protein
MSILSKFAALETASNKAGRTPMSAEQIQSCRDAIRSKGRGYNVHPNRFDIQTPYSVSINYDNNWNNYGSFKSADVAAAVGTIVSVAYFGEKAKRGNYSESVVESSEEFTTWLADERNADIIAKANGDAPQIHQVAATTPAGEVTF